MQGLLDYWLLQTSLRVGTASPGDWSCMMAVSGEASATTRLSSTFLKQTWHARNWAICISRELAAPSTVGRFC